MHKISSFFFITVMGLFFYTNTTFAQEFPKLDTSPMDLAVARGENQKMVARIIYSRPQKKGREIFGKLVPYGKVWRTGANEATELDLYTPVMLGNTRIEAGTYTIYTIPNEKEWVFVLNTETNIWGVNFKEELDLLRIKIPVRKAAAPIESLSMAFRPEEGGISLMIGWDDTFVEIPFKFVE